MTLDLSPVRVGAAGTGATLVGVFSTWSSGDGVTLNGIQGPHNGWVAVIYTLVAVVAVWLMRRSTWPAIATTASAGMAVTLAVLTTHGPVGAGKGWGWWFTLIGGLTIMAAAGWAALERVRGDDAVRWKKIDSSAPKSVAGGVFVAVLALMYAVFGQVLMVEEQHSWPPGPDAITPATAQRETERFVAGNPGPRDLGLDYSWATAATIEPWVEGVDFFPRIFADIDDAETSVHIIMFGWNSEKVGTELAELLHTKLDEGVEVRVIVDSQGSDPYGPADAMYRGLADAGAEIVVNDVVQADSDGLFSDRSLDWRQDEVGRADHRKLYVIDGVVMWTGGAGVEDHFRDGGFHDVMVRVTGDVVRQAQSIFLTSFRTHDAPLPGDLTPYFPDQPVIGTIPAAIVQVVPGGYVSATQAIREMIDGAQQRLDIMNAYLTDRDMIERIINAAERGVEIRVVVSEASNNSYATAALRHRYGDMLDAGVEIWEYPDAVVHAKLVVADEMVNFGTVNFDNWALYRNFEIAIIAESPATAQLLEDRVFAPDIARSHPGEALSGFVDTLEGWLWDKLSYFL